MKKISFLILFFLIITPSQAAEERVVMTGERTITIFYNYNPKYSPGWADTLQNNLADRYCLNFNMDAYRGLYDHVDLEGAVYMGGKFAIALRYFCAKNDNDAKTFYQKIIMNDFDKDLINKLEVKDRRLAKKILKKKLSNRKYLKKKNHSFVNNKNPIDYFMIKKSTREKDLYQNRSYRFYTIIKYNAYSAKIERKKEEIRIAKQKEAEKNKPKIVAKKPETACDKVKALFKRKKESIIAKEKDIISRKKIIGPVEYQRQAGLLKIEFEKYKKNKAKAEEDCKDSPQIASKPKPNDTGKKIIQSSDIDNSLITIGSGSGFYINNKGYALTNNHVIDICKQSIALIDGKETLFRVIATDKTNDVAVLKTNLRSRNYIRINEDGAKLGENVIAVGYPLAGRLSDSVKITRGIVSSTSGLNNNIGQIQIDAALQPGNSGGPVLNENGELVGIASAGLNKLLMAKEAKYIPENVNFAVASPIVVNILKSKKIKYSTPSMFSGSYSNTELAELGNSSTIQLFCRNTRTAYNRLKSSNKYSTVLLDLD
tara:strand:+ start:163 stop:1788 length:1626 start_codon:yes stop_codon:yes gene_type:complete